jgi:hypothetical protein
VFLRLLEQHQDLATLMLQYVQARMVIMAQMTLCNAVHSVEQKIRRWLLVAQYMTKERDLCFTHEQIARLVGIRRPSASESIGNLERAGLVGQARKCITVLDAEGLELHACNCHKQIVAEFNRVLGSTNADRPFGLVPPLALLAVEGSRDRAASG